MNLALCGYLGSGCTEVAEVLAGKLELEVYNTSRILGSMKNLESLTMSGEFDFDGVVKTRVEQILKLNNVIVEGRTAFMLLDRKDLVKIFLNTPFEDRIKHVASRRGVSVEKARDDVKRSDEDRNHLIQRVYRKECSDVSNYDFAISVDSKSYSEIANKIFVLIT